MGKMITLGGKRLGSGKKMDTELNNYGRSTQNLSTIWRSSMNVGTLIPFFSEPATAGDTWDIDLGALLRTVPTTGPLLGEYKLQIDFFQCPIRLYQGILHNNPVELGLNMNKVLLPKIVYEDVWQVKNNNNSDQYINGFNHSSLPSYLGVNGIGRPIRLGNADKTMIRQLQCVPELAYYDIFKNYYANKQEDNAYIIGGGTDLIIKTMYVGDESDGIDLVQRTSYAAAITKPITITLKEGYTVPEKNTTEWNTLMQTIKIKLYWPSHASNEILKSLYECATATRLNDSQIQANIVTAAFDPTIVIQTAFFEANANESGAIRSKPTLISFPLKNIDEMRNHILKNTELGQRVIVGRTDDTFNKLPYKQLCGTFSILGQYRSINALPQNGIAIKTHQSDIFNNWLKTETLTGENGISQITSVDVSEGKLNLDSLLLAQKVYNMLNQIYASGGTYEDWQLAVYGIEAVRKCETPIYLGGMSASINFEEVVSTAKTEGKNIGDLAGKGVLGNKKGGHITVKVDELSYIMGIVSITPRIDYFQGNKWHRTELDNVDDFHKPAMDGIGFQDLITENMAWWDTELRKMGDGTNSIPQKYSAGKIPAWMFYRTNWNEVKGDFAENLKWMAILRNYSMVEDYENHSDESIIKDLTTYIDPSKYNQPFADQSLTAQNFWVQIGMKISSRRKISARIIPNL